MILLGALLVQNIHPRFPMNKAPGSSKSTRIKCMPIKLRCPCIDKLIHCTWNFYFSVSMKYSNNMLRYKASESFSKKLLLSQKYPQFFRYALARLLSTCIWQINQEFLQGTNEGIHKINNFIERTYYTKPRTMHYWVLHLGNTSRKTFSKGISRVSICHKQSMWGYGMERGVEIHFTRAHTLPASDQIIKLEEMESSYTDEFSRHGATFTRRPTESEISWHLNFSHLDTCKAVTWGRVGCSDHPSVA